MRRIEQIPTPPNEWLCTDLASVDCIFAKKILRIPESPALAECTNEEKEAWEEEHKPEPKPEPADTGGNFRRRRGIAVRQMFNHLIY